MKKWIAGIFATVIGGILIALFSGKIDPSRIVKIIQNFECDSTWVWDSKRSQCVLNVTIPEKLVSVNLDRKIDTIEGRIDFYLNRKRLPNSNGQARYDSAPGTVQIVIPVMKGKTMVGDAKEVIYETTKGRVCALKNVT